MKKLALAFSLIIVLSMLSGCINGGSESTAPPETTLSPTEVPTTPASSTTLPPTTTPAPTTPAPTTTLPPTTTPAPTTLPPTTTPVPTWSPDEEAYIDIGEEFLFGTHRLLLDDWDVVEGIIDFYLDDVQFSEIVPYEIEGDDYNLVLKVYYSATSGYVFKIEYRYMG